MGARCSEVDVTHALPANLGLRNFNATLLANNSAVLEAFVLAAKAFVVFDRAKNLGTEQAFALGFEGAVVDGFGFLDFTKRPGTDLFRRSHADFDGIEMLIRGELLEEVE